MISRSSKTLKFGARFLGFDARAAELIEYGKLAEKYGFDFCWYPHDTFMRNTWVLLSALAVETNKIELGTVGTNPYTTDPSEIATFLATLDELSKGRAVLGLGLHTIDMIGWVGIEARDPIARTREAVQLIRNCFDSLQEKISEPFHGKEFNWGSEAYLRFKPYRPRPPIYIAGFGKSFNELSGEIGDGSLPMVTPPESASYMVEPIIEGCRKARRDIHEIDIAGCAWISISKDDPRSAKEKLKQIISYFGPYLEEGALNTVGLHQNDFEAIRKEIMRGRYDLANSLVTEEMLRLGITGTPSECIERIATLRKAGITQVSLGGPWGPDVTESIRIVGEEIIPVLRS